MFIRVEETAGHNPLDMLYLLPLYIMPPTLREPAVDFQHHNTDVVRLALTILTFVQLRLRKQLHRAGNMRRGNWLAEQITLRMGASIGTDSIKFFLGLDSLSQNRYADAFAQHHNRTDNGALFRRDTDERTIYLNGVKW